MSQPTQRVPSSRPRAGRSWIAIALALAVSPGLASLAEHWLAEPWTRYSLVYAPLLWLSVRASASGPRSGDPFPSRFPSRYPSATGIALIVLGVALQVIASSISMPALGRLAVGMVLAGFLSLDHDIGVRRSLLALWLVPLPFAVSTWLGGAHLTGAVFSWAASPLALAGLEFEHGWRQVAYAGQALDLPPERCGVVLAAHLAGLAWYALDRLQARAALSTVTLVLAAAAAIPATVLFAMGALVLLALGSATAAGFWLDYAPWLTTTALVVGWTSARIRARDAGGDPH